MTGAGDRLLRWWKSASTQSRWVAGIVLFSLVCTAALLLITDSSTAGSLSEGGGASLAGDPSPLFYLDAFLKLLFVIGLIVGGAVVARHYSGKKIFHNPSRQLEVLETVRLSPRQALLLVRVGERSLLVGATDQGFSLLSDLGKQVKTEEPVQVLEAPETFQNILESVERDAQQARHAPQALKAQ